MADTAQPAAKLQKSDAGDVADASRVQASATPSADATPGAVQAADGVQQGHQVEAKTASGDTAPQEKGKKRKVALYVAYIGAGYHGMQRNPGYPSIEGELEKAICRAGGISAANAESFSKINWMRAARTDKGVSAVGQLVSLKMVVGQPNHDIVEHINKHLPDQIRVLGYTKTTAGFDARKHCDKRRYEYVLPAWAFDPTACRGRLCVEEAELRSATDPAVSEGVLPSDPVRVKPGQQSAGGAAEAVAEATAAAVGAEAGAANQSTVQEHNFPLQHNPGAAEADLPKPSPAEVLQTAPVAGKGLLQAPQSEGALSPSANVPAQDSTTASRPDQVSSETTAPSSASASALPQGTSNSPALGQVSVPQSAAYQPQGVANGPAPEGSSSSPAPGNSNQSGPPGGGPALQSQTEQAPKSDFVFDDAAARRLNIILKQYQGTHNFHNFTVRLEASDPSAKRYMLSCKCPGTFEIKGQQWVKIVIIGQSFMLHQIRKMVGMAVANMRGDAPANCIRIALQPQRAVPTPMAPEIGLFLDECYYDAYNTRWGADHEHVTLSQFEDRVAEFKAELMYPHIAETDARTSINASWLRTLTNRSFHFEQWADEKLFKATVGPKGEKAIFNGDLLPSPAGAACIVGGQESYGMSGRGKGRGGYKGHAGDKRSRNQENGTQQAQPQKSIVEVSMEHEFSD